FDDDCERRRLIYIDEIQPGTSLPKWRRRTFINALSSVKQPSVGCKEIYKSPFGKYPHGKETTKKGAYPVSKRHMDKLLSNCQLFYLIIF
ncbi:MAG TPA: hypothetical protein H9934_12605, partial [Candidatus Anaerobutyricum faecale]|nr:hypothetical protein [Candidatus Anaerobutyricum faecale]